ncbi:hypothetical protein Ga0123461_1418 [Mariprofundus aestuarium]|uniref:Porin n=1 Tax=Mariprofundus aestuarium TaxID=1921086 RepID=A0A2K8KYJ2_MARES|nr:hypothetical protein [Mariprofundus aestuarium]ATX79832.1 hypothetical protein Ga0123461_1418 [Mariprofundus aestuarium]
MKSGVSTVRIILVTLVLVVFAQPAHAFFSWQGDDSAIEMRAMLAGSGLWLNNPDNPLYYNKRSVAGVAASGRLMIDASIGGAFSFEMHAVQNYVPLDLQSGGSNIAVLRDVERSDLLDWSFDSRRAHLLIDRLNLQYASQKLNLKVGRQPVNLAATFYFTPNDFFAPFAAQTFFRAYKPGVDAVRADIQLAELSQLSLISVLGYSADSFSGNGWSNSNAGARNSYLARTSGVIGDFELALIVGSVKGDVVIGTDFQGELFEWLGVRGEGHVNIPDQPGLNRRIEFAIGLEHRWDNSLALRAEQFYHGGGVSSSAAYATPVAAQGFYMARNYTALGASYEFTPLLSGDMTAIYNWMDNSSLVAVYALYSLSDESELAISGSLSHGKRPAGASINSEFGLYPNSIGFEVRSYF